MGIEDIRDALVIREGSCFLLTDADGNAPAGNTRGYGLYHADTRHLSAYDLTLNGVRPVVLLSTAHLGYAMEQVMTNPLLSDSHGHRVARGSVEIRRERVVADVVEETLRLTNYNAFSVTLSLLYEFGADFADIFDVRGYARHHFGRMLPPETDERSITYAYEGVDGERRETHVLFNRQPNYLDPTTALFRVTLAPREVAHLNIEISPHVGKPPLRAVEIRRIAALAEERRQWLDACTHISTDNDLVDRGLARSLQDVRMLWSHTGEGEQYPAAGTPWFDALFGRDSCILAMQMMAHRPDIAREVLTVLAKHQGSRLDPSRDEEPGKILHELRFDELSRSGELPYAAYYGSVDSTPLFLMLVAEYFDWSGDAAFVRHLLPSIEAALSWMTAYGDPRASGYLAYEKHSARGLVNQGWKDSWDAVMHADGSLAKAPIALVEAQGYAYAARVRIAGVLDALGAEGKRAHGLREQAASLRERFNHDFWMDDESYFALALDGDLLPVRSFASNPAHCLWSGIVDAPRAAPTVHRLLSDDLFSGWGLRTLSSLAPRYNPIGYHVGTIWPHDNSIAAMGLKMYGFTGALNAIAEGMFEASASFPYSRLPELFGGDARTPYGPPVPYPVACRPQSWAAGSLPLMMRAILGLCPTASEGRLSIIDPKLPPWLGSVNVRGLRVGQGTVDLDYRRRGEATGVEVLGATGGVKVSVEQAWPGIE